MGFKQTGKFTLLAAAEIQESARETYKRNIPDNPETFVFIKNVIGYDFKKLSESLGGIDIVIGGPPCQGFSNANRQKNHLISLNNALVKEFFRAIKEIQPKAFVMENVNMLESNTHRFYDSEKDHDVITALIEKGYKIPLKEDKLFITKDAINEFDILSTVSDCKKVQAFLLPKKLFQLLHTMKKHKGNKERLKSFLEKNSKTLTKKIDEYYNSAKAEDVLAQWNCRKLKHIREAISSIESVANCVELSELIELQKNMLAALEIYQNKLIGDFLRTDSGTIVFKTNSYAVIDYVSAILGDDYFQRGATVNAKWCGVPQERKRHIVIGIHRREGAEPIIAFPTEDPASKIYTVKDAIYDLKDCEVCYDLPCLPVPYSPTEDISSYAQQMREGSETVKNHIATNTTPTAKKRFNAIEPGHNFHSLSQEMKSTYSKPERTQNTIYLKLDPQKPSDTVVNVRKSMWIHPTLSRAISVREAARLQSFPDTFEFWGSKGSQYQQVGNAVPPLLSKAIAEKLLQLI